MPFALVIFNKEGHWDWLNKMNDISLNEIKNGDCFIGYMFECLWPDKL
uniref:Uncharacterized protein n=1 Tax=Salmonella sp. 96A-29192 TaxID=1179814 RepID=I3VZQ0_9ENTR|nr:hypothetical protein [Salmonella sp. 96A-29192]